jgi:hypothetical protein
MYSVVAREILSSMLRDVWLRVRVVDGVTKVLLWTARCVGASWRILCWHVLGLLYFVLASMYKKKIDMQGT